MTRVNKIVLCGMLLLCVGLSGCIQFPIHEEHFRAYNQTVLGQSGSGDVMVYMEMPEKVYVSQADTVVASWYNTENWANRQWLTMVAFDEDTANAVRKYFVFVDEKARRIPILYPKSSVRFDAELMIDKAVLEKAYADENFRNIAILQEVQKEFGKDIEKVTPDNKSLTICQMVMSESFNQALLQLKESPVLAGDLTKCEGFKFDSMNLKDGKICMKEEGGIVTVDIKIGAVPWCKAKSEPGRPYVPKNK